MEFRRPWVFERTAPGAHSGHQSEPSRSAALCASRQMRLGYTGVVRWFLLAVTASVLFAADPLADSAQKKLDSISDRKLKPGSAVILSSREINAWIHEKAAKAFPEGIRNEREDLGPGTTD